MPEDRSAKLGPGADYRPEFNVGSAQQIPTINSQSQSAISNALRDGNGPTINGGDVPSRIISRESLAQDNYAGKPGSV
jgi:hypothetical protein